MNYAFAYWIKDVFEINQVEFIAIQRVRPIPRHLLLEY
jgi:hypothetical protein